MSVADGKEVALQLQADVASGCRFLTRAVAKAAKGVDDVGIGIPPLGNGIGGILECECPLELSDADSGLLVFSPLDIEVYQLHGRFARSFVARSLYLDTPVEVADFAVEHHTHETQIELVVVVTFLIFKLIL